ncbi:DUF202 domain-containing protein [Auraticoccus sp. F435]|uniref:DUF202 domain-containing protein n=1 Tax=Auraticoccus cholistanensis TaxID=2656650 RepID=A0A6A9V0H7_9ACTN|nr:DUF202 domain-containing protein [Auraticoccus cholistanensis]
MTDPDAAPDRRWPRSIFGVGEEPDPRFSFANERTFLAWIRTGLGFLTAGVALVTVSELVPGRDWATHLAAGALILCGVLSGVAALARWMRSEQALRLGRPLPSSPMMPVLTGALVVVALVALLLLLAP